MQKQFMKLTLAVFAMLLSVASMAQAKWSVDKVHSSVKFSVTHMMVSEVEGAFKVFDGSLTASKADLSDAAINFSVDVASVNTDNEFRDKHLKSDDFFNVEKFPQMKFVSKSFTPAGGKNYKLVGDLTIRDVTKTVTFDVVYGGQLDTGKGIKSGFKAKTTIDRTQFGVKFTGALAGGGLAVGNDVEITVLLEMNKQ